MFHIGGSLPEITWTRAEHILEAQKMPQTHKGNVETENACFKDVFKKNNNSKHLKCSIFKKFECLLYFLD